MKLSYLSAVAAVALLASPALAADEAKKKEPEAPKSLWDETTITGYVEGSDTFNPNLPYNKLNFGRLFDDRANTPLFNQGSLTVQRPLDPKATGFDFGYKFQGMIGSDARYTHFLGEFDYALHSRTQLDVVEAFAIAHLPVVTDFTEGGIDVKVGQFVTLEGAEVINSPDNPLFSHSYIFNFGIPLKHTGIMTITHVKSWLDLYAGVTTGVNTTFGWTGDNNSAVSFHGGIGLNLLDGNLTVLATTHIGPENPRQLDPLYVGWPNFVIGGIPAACVCNPNDTARYLNDITITWKATDDLTFITDLNYIRDNGWNPTTQIGLTLTQLNGLGLFGYPTQLVPQRAKGVQAFGVAQYGIYKINDLIKLAARLEIFRDAENFFVAGFPGYFDYVNLEHGFTNQAIAAGPAGNGTTYFGATLGATITPELPTNNWVKNVILRPEVRWDRAFNGTTPFFGGLNGSWPYIGVTGRKSSQVTIGLNAIIPFTLK
jgi:hypothetical protein